MSDDLAAFLRARLDDDEQAARAAGGDRWAIVPRHQDPTIRAGKYPTVDRFDILGLDSPEVGQTWAVERAVHIVRHDPARVLADVAAKREMVKLHGPVVLRGGPGAKYFDTTTVCGSCEPPQFPEHAFPCKTLRLLAAVWSDHPDYREEWKP